MAPRDTEDTTNLTMSALRELGIGCQLEPDRALEGLTGAPSRIHVRGSRIAPDAPMAGFTLHLGRDVAFLSLFSGILYRIAPSLVVDCVNELTRHDHRLGGGTPRVVSREVIRKYHLTEGMALYAFAAPVSGPLASLLSRPPQGAASWEAPDEKLINGQLEVGSFGLFTIKLSNERYILTRLRGRRGRPCAYLTCFLSGGRNIVAHYKSLLQSLAKVWRCVFYDGSWGNQILWDDPYYSVADSVRPDHPRNA